MLKSAQRGRGGNGGGGDVPLFVRCDLSSSSTHSTTRQRADLILFATCVDTSLVLSFILF
jgi:hypothetical protein